MGTIHCLTFSDQAVVESLDTRSDDAIEDLEFGVIGFDAAGIVRRDNAFESQCAGLPAARDLRSVRFTVVAPSMNNFMVAQRFEGAAAAAEKSDVTIDYVLTLRGRPSRGNYACSNVPTATCMRYVLVNRRA